MTRAVKRPQCISPNATTTGRFKDSTSSVPSTVLDGLQMPSMFPEVAQCHGGRGASMILG
ncbi:hypothetical protein K525DRAFT_270822 [Schizophyllum commune Loenen D]|nr:hypothetical protein K525DRAFT_270822 [Schizophyllum commune Loenen D]